MSPGYQKRTADAAPDYIFKAPKEGELRIAPVITDEPDVTDNVKDKENTSSVEIPETRVSRVDTLPAKEKKRISHRRNPSDAQPDYIDDISETGKKDIFLFFFFLSTPPSHILRRTIDQSRVAFSKQVEQCRGIKIKHRSIRQR